MPYYECPKCGGGYVIDPAPPHPVCDRDQAPLKRVSDAYYEAYAREDEAPSPPRARPSKKKSS